MASMQSLLPAIMIITLSVFLIAVGMIITDDMAYAVGDVFSGEVELQNITDKNVTPVGTDASLYLDVELSSVVVTCAGGVLDPAEWSAQCSTGLEINYSCTAPCTYNNTNCTVTGTANTDKAAFTAVNSTSVAIANIVDWFPLIVIVIVTAIVLGIVIRGFSGGTSL